MQTPTRVRRQGGLRTVQSNEDLRSILANRRKSSLGSNEREKEMSEEVQKILRSHSLIRAGKAKGKAREDFASIQEDQEEGGAGTTVGLGLFSLQEEVHDRPSTSMSTTTDGGNSLIDAFPAPPVHLPGLARNTLYDNSIPTTRARSTPPVAGATPAYTVLTSHPSLPILSQRGKGRITPLESPKLIAPPMVRASSLNLPPSLPLPPLPSPRRASTDAAFESHSPPSIPLPALPNPLSVSSPILHQVEPSIFTSPPIHVQSSPVLDFDLYLDESSTSPISFEDLISAPLPKRRLSHSPSFQRSRPSSSQHHLGVPIPDPEDSQESEIDLETGLETMAWRAGVMKKAFGGMASSEEEEEKKRPITPERSRERRSRERSNDEKEMLWRNSKSYRPSYKLVRKNSTATSTYDRDSSSEEEELFDLSFDSHSMTSGSTPSFSPFSSYRRSTSSSTATSHSFIATPKPGARLSREYFSLSPPNNWDDLSDQQRKSWGSATNESEVGKETLGAPWKPIEEAKAIEADALTPKKPTMRKIPSLSGLRRPSVVAPAFPRRPSDASSTSSSTSLDSDRVLRQSKSSTGLRSSSGLPTPMSSTLRKSLSPPASRRDSIASSIASTSSSRSELRHSFEPLDTPPPLPGKSFGPKTPSTMTSTTTSGIARPITPSTRPPVERERAKTPSSLPKPTSSDLPRRAASSSAPPTRTSSRSPTNSRSSSISPKARLSSLPYVGAMNGSVSKLILPTKIASSTTALPVSRLRPPAAVKSFDR